MCSEGKDLCSEILAVLINPGRAQLMDSAMAEHTARQLQITQTVVMTRQIDCGVIGKCDPDTGIALKDKFCRKTWKGAKQDLSPASTLQEVT